MIPESLAMSSGDIVKVTGIAVATFNRWAGEGVVEPLNMGDGHGWQRLYDLVGVVAISYGNRWRGEGCSADWVKVIIKTVADLKLDGLKMQLKSGRTFLCPMPVNPFFINSYELPSDTPEQCRLSEWLDLKNCFRDTIVAIEELLQEPSKPVGRKRASAKGCGWWTF